MEQEQDIRKSEWTTVASVGAALFILPGFLILTVLFSTNLGQFNPFLILLLFFFSGILALIGLITYLIADKRLKRKVTTVLAGFGFYILLLPIHWGVMGVRERIYISDHQRELEAVANELLTSKITTEEANEKLQSKNIILKVSCVPKENMHVLFLLDGILDNCSGFSYSLSDKQPTENCCGDLIYWKKMKRNWYKWGTT